MSWGCASTLPPPPAIDLAGSYVVLTIPEGRYTLEERLMLERPWLVLRGAGAGKTVLHIPKSEPAPWLLLLPLLLSLLLRR